MDFPLFFAVLLYLNVYYFGFFAVFEFLLLLFKATQMPDSKYEMSTAVNEVIILTFLVVVESVRLMLGQQHNKTDFHRNLFAVFRILVLTAPSMYAVAYFTFWQNYVSRLDFSLGLVMLVIQTFQLFSCFVSLVLAFIRPLAAVKSR